MYVGRQLDIAMPFEDVIRPTIAAWRYLDRSCAGCVEQANRLTRRYGLYLPLPNSTKFDV